MVGVVKVDMDKLGVGGLCYFRDPDLMKGIICIQCHVISMYSLIISGFKNILSTSTIKKRLNITRLLLYIWSKNLMMEPAGAGFSCTGLANKADFQQSHGIDFATGYQH